MERELKRLEEQKQQLGRLSGSFSSSDEGIGHCEGHIRNVGLPIPPFHVFEGEFFPADAGGLITEHFFLVFWKYLSGCCSIWGTLFVHLKLIVSTSWMKVPTPKMVHLFKNPTVAPRLVSLISNSKIV